MTDLPISWQSLITICSYQVTLETLVMFCVYFEILVTCV